MLATSERRRLAAAPLAFARQARDAAGSRPGAVLALASLVVMTFWLLAFRPAFDSYWNWDDVHLIRTFTAEEIATAFTGNWDPAGIETRGYRPFSLLFNHARALVFGEWLAGHRALSLLLSGCLLWLVGRSALRLGLGLPQVLLAIGLLAVNKGLVLDALWLADNLHLFEWVLVALAVALMLAYLDRGGAWRLGLLVAAGWVAIWTREEAAVVVFVLPLLAFAATGPAAGGWRSVRTIWSDRRFAAVLAATGLLGVIVLATMVYRLVVVPEAASLLSPVAGGRSAVQALFGLMFNLKATLLITGGPVQPSLGFDGIEYVQTGGWELELLTLVWAGLLGAVGTAFLLVSRQLALRQVGVALLGLLACCLPGLIVPRANTLLAPSIFFCFAVASALIEVRRVVTEGGASPALAAVQAGLKGPTGMRPARVPQLTLMALVVATLGCAVGGSLYRTWVQQQDLHAMSVNQLRRDAFMVFELPASARAKVPPARLAYLEAKLCHLGICSRADVEPRVAALIAEAAASEWPGWGQPAGPFVPRVMYLAP